MSKQKIRKITCRNCGAVIEDVKGNKQFCDKKCCQEHRQKLIQQKNWMHGTFWILTECSPEDSDPEKMEFHDGIYYKWVKEVRP